MPPRASVEMQRPGRDADEEIGARRQALCRRARTARRDRRIASRNPAAPSPRISSSIDTKRQRGDIARSSGDELARLRAVAPVLAGRRRAGPRDHAQPRTGRRELRQAFVNKPARCRRGARNRSRSQAAPTDRTLRAAPAAPAGARGCAPWCETDRACALPSRDNPSRADARARSPSRLRRAARGARASAPSAVAAPQREPEMGRAELAAVAGRGHAAEQRLRTRALPSITLT